jgi:ribonuclease P protein component
MAFLHSVNKGERLKSASLIELLFKKGKVIKYPGIRAVYLSVDQFDSYIQIGVAVSKKSFPLAVTRNKIKRRIREAYRKNKENLTKVLTGQNARIALMLVYTSREEMSYSSIEEKIILTLLRLQRDYEERSI